MGGGEERGDAEDEFVKAVGDMGHGFTKGMLLAGEGELLIGEKDESNFQLIRRS